MGLSIGLCQGGEDMIGLLCHGCKGGAEIAMKVKVKLRGMKQRGASKARLRVLGGRWIQLERGVSVMRIWRLS